MIELDDVHFSFDPGHAPDVLRGVTLEIAAGSHVALLGRNGSGKSSLARLLNGLLVADRGSVRVAGLDPGDPREVGAVRRRVQMVFQNPENQQVGTTVFEDVAFGLSGIGHPTALMQSRTREALAMVGLEVSLDRSVSTLSGGQLQRLALASCLALDPDVLVLDEVTSMLDPEAARLVGDSLAKLRADRPLTVVQITHHLEEVEHADRAVLLHEGQVVADDTPAAIFIRPDLVEACGLEVPYRWRRPRTESADQVPTPRPATAGRPVVQVTAAAVAHGPRGSRRHTRPRLPRRGPAPAEVLHDLDLQVAPGELMALAGRSGAGKSTLVSLVKGLLPPVRGAMLIQGVDPWRPFRPELFDPVGYLFQRPEHQLFAPTVRADVAYGLLTTDLSDQERAARVDGALHRLGLDPDEVGDRSPFDLSGGQQRRVAIAGVLVGDPDVLLLDEPTAGLDHPSREALFAILHDVRAAGTAVIWVSHRHEEVLSHADRLVVLDGGTIAADGPPLVVLTDPALRKRMGWQLPPHLDDRVREGEALGEHDGAPR